MSKKRLNKTAILKAFRRRLARRWLIKKPVKVFLFKRCEKEGHDAECFNRGSYFEVRLMSESMSLDDCILCLCHEWAHMSLWPDPDSMDHYLSFYERKCEILRWACKIGLYH